MAMAVPPLAYARLREVLMVNIKPPPSDWTEAIGNVAKRFMNARVCFFRSDNAGDYDALTNTGKRDGVEIIWAGPARVQHLRSPQKASTNYEVGNSRSFRFQLDKGAAVPFLPSGTKARVLDAGVPGHEMLPGDRDLENLVYVVESAINASHQAVRTVELTANMRKMDWGWQVNEGGEVV